MPGFDGVGPPATADVVDRGGVGGAVGELEGEFFIEGEKPLFTGDAADVAAATAAGVRW